MDQPNLSLQARRLGLAAALNRRIERRLPEPQIALAATRDDMLMLARDLASDIESFEQVHRLTFSPPYPGISEGVQRIRGGLRLVLTSEATDKDLGAIGAVFTTLIAGRAPLVSVAPPLSPRHPSGRSRDGVSPKHLT